VLNQIFRLDGGLCSDDIKTRLNYSAHSVQSPGQDLSWHYYASVVDIGCFGRNLCLLLGPADYLKHHFGFEI
jgi:hypothetical protein